MSCVFSRVGSDKSELASGGALRNLKGACFHVPDVMAIHVRSGLALLRSLFPGQQENMSSESDGHRRDSICSGVTSA